MIYRWKLDKCIDIVNALLFPFLLETNIMDDFTDEEWKRMEKTYIEIYFPENHMKNIFEEFDPSEIKFIQSDSRLQVKEFLFDFLFFVCLI